MRKIKKLFKEAYRKLRFRLSENNSILFIGFYKYFYFPKKDSLEEFLDNYSKNNLGRLTVFQVGANDGITHDPIHKFIKRDKWKGVLLEPQKYVFDNFLSRIYRNNEGIHVMNAALGPKDCKGEIYRIGFTNSRWAHGLSSFRKETLLEAFSNGYVKRQSDKENTIIPENPDKWIVAEPIDIFSPTTIINSCRISSIDLLMIDAEGYDVEIIKIFFNEGILPRVIVFEKGHLDDALVNECNALLKSKGYYYRNAGANTIAMQMPLGRYEHWFCQSKLVFV